MQLVQYWKSIMTLKKTNENKVLDRLPRFCYNIYIVIFLTACTQATTWSVECTDGFSTGISSNARFSNSAKLIYYRKYKTSSWKEYAIPEEVECKRTRQEY